MNLMDSLADHGRIDVWSMVPSIVDELGETPDVLAKFKSSKFICASGGTHILSIVFPFTIIALTLLLLRARQSN